ncbi:mitochondrial inner membrane protein-domain-containing protein [Chiua virens]|nr:mitochondrial inner membrane protein-domain-containing protein [Chiua virens]
MASASEDRPALSVEENATTSPPLKLEPTMHSAFDSPDADVVLVSHDLVRFRMHSFTLKTTSGPEVTSAIIAGSEQRSALNPSAANPETIHLNEDSTTLELLFRMISGLPIQPLTLFDTVDALLFASEKYETPGPTSLVRIAVLTSPLAEQPLRLYAAASRCGWTEEAKVASHRTLSKIEVRSALVLLKLHRSRREELRKKLDEHPFVAALPREGRLTSTNATSTSASVSSAPKKLSNVAQKLVFCSVTATGTFYIGSTFVSHQSQQYRDLFTKHVPLGNVLVEYAEQHQWDEITVQQVVVTTVDTAKSVYGFVQRQLSQGTQKTDTPAQDKETPRESKKSSLHETKARIKSTAAALKATVDKSLDQLSPEAYAPSAELARHKAQQFTSEVDELIRKAEVALAVPIESTPESTPALANVEVFVLMEKSDDPSVYAAPLPIGFEPPPGFSKPKAAPKPARDVLPLVAPAASDVAISEPVISHLAGTIDDLASYLNANPTAAEKAKGILDNVRTDLTEFATRFDKIKEDEEHELEVKLDEQAREYSTKLLEQDKLALQRRTMRNTLQRKR